MLFHLKKVFVIVPLLLIFSIETFSQPDTLWYILDSTVFVSRKNTSGLRGRANQFSLDSGLSSALPRIFGSAEAFRLIQYLPGVQTNAEYDNGIRIQGCDNSHNHISIDGIPVYGSTHFLGLFSIFNNSHFKSLEYSSQSLIPNRLGGEINMIPKTDIHKGVTGDFEIGLMSSQGTVIVPFGEKLEVGVSMRLSYLNLLYGKFLEIDDNPLRYSFGDFNFSLLWNVSDNDKIWAESYFGRDMLKYSYSSLLSDMYFNFGNVLAGLNWRHKWRKGMEMTQKLYFTRYGVNAEIVQDILAASIPSHIRTIGYNSIFTKDSWNFGLEFQVHNVMPQCPYSSWLAQENPKEIQEAVETSVWAKKSWEFDSGLDLDAYAKLSTYISPESQLYFAFSPHLKLSYKFYRFGEVSIAGGSQSQNIFQTGVSNTGTPIEFYFLAGQHCKPQKSINIEFNYDIQLIKDLVNLSTTVYYKHLLNQVEYYGNLMELLSRPYSLDNSIIVGIGDNFGFSVLARKNSGNFTGWISYSLGRSLRHFDSDILRGTFPSSHERIHQMNAVINYKLKRWDFGGTFVLGSGTPFTAPKFYYLFGNQIVAENGEFNGSRMPAYIRLDFSFNYHLHEGPELENGFNLSIYNVLCRKNSMLCSVKEYQGIYGYYSTAIPILFMPTIGYFHKF